MRSAMVRAGLQRDALRYEAVAVASCSGIIKQKGEGQGQLALSIRLHSQHATDFADSRACRRVTKMHLGTGSDTEFRRKFAKSHRLSARPDTPAYKRPPVRCSARHAL